MRSGHYNRGKADARRRASGKLRLCSVCCRAHCCGALGRGFCRWRTVRTQVFAAQLAGPVRPTVPVKGCGTTLAAPGRTRHPFLRLCQPPYFKKHMQKSTLPRSVFWGRAIFSALSNENGSSFRGKAERTACEMPERAQIGKKMQARKEPYLRFAYSSCNAAS